MLCILQAEKHYASNSCKKKRNTFLLNLKLSFGHVQMSVASDMDAGSDMDEPMGSQSKVSTRTRFKIAQF